MKISCPDFDQMMSLTFTQVYRFCFLLTVDPENAWAAAFQTYLYMGTRSTTGSQEELYAWCVRTCKDLYYRKIRRSPRREKLEKSVPFPVSDELWELLRLPIRSRIHVFQEFLADEGCPGDGVFGSDRSSGGGSGESRISSAQRAAICSIQPAPGSLDRMNDEIYLRFEERNVPLENTLRIIRSRWDHIVIGLAAVVLLLFAAAIWYTAGLTP